MGEFTETQKKMFTKDGNVRRYINSDVVDEFKLGGCCDISFPNGYGKGKRTYDDVCCTLACASTNQICVKVEEDLKTKLCNSLIKNNIAKENDVIKHSYTSQIIDGNKKCIEMNNIMPTLTTRADCLGVCVKENEMNNLRIRKLTPRECFRLMAVKDSDYDNVSKNQSNASLFHLARDSIVSTCLMAIFGELLDINWQEKVNELVEFKGD